MPTFTAIALDRLIEPGASKSMGPTKNAAEPVLQRRNSTPNARTNGGNGGPGSKLERGISVPDPKLNGRNRTSSSTTSLADRKHHWTQISPALYATPKSTPLPDSPSSSSYPPSPYIVNHKRRGPRLLKSFSEDDVATREVASDDKKVEDNGKDASKEVTVVSNMSKDDSYIPKEIAEEDDSFAFSIPPPAPIKEENSNGSCDSEGKRNHVVNGPAGQNGMFKSVSFNVQRDAEADDFFDPQDSASVKSNTESEGNGQVEHSFNLSTPVAEFYDAWEELSSENGPQTPMPDIEAELREIRLSLLMEVEKRKQAEEALTNMRTKWQIIREQLSLVGLTLPADPVALMEGDQLDAPVEELCQQVHLARFVSNSIGRGTAKAEIEMEMEAQIELKNFEIARLWDRLHYYEAVNREMSQRNQETVEISRRLRHRRKRRQRWIWGSIAAAITLGSAVLAWSYIPSGKESSCSGQSNLPEGDHRSQ